MNVFNLLATLSLDTSDYEDKLKDAESGVGGAAAKLGNGLKTAAKIGTAAIGAASTAVGALAKASLSSYASYEQLVGGIDKLYGDASQKMLEYANEAYKTSGMSANQYMETATSFSAALITSLGGDTQKAAELTDVAMRAMSDNVNVFGSDMQSVQYAFQGFAKQNYTMLDNLKLGYGGTKAEMERLIEDAASYTKEQKELNMTVDAGSMSFDNIVRAIQVVQKHQNIAGTTGLEAMKTIEGAATATRAAWENVITAIGGGGDIGAAMDQFTNAVFGEKEGEGLLNQVIPRLEMIFDGIGQFVAKAAPYINQYLPPLFEQLLPAFTAIATSLITAVVPLLPGIAKAIIDAFGQALSNEFPSLSFIFDNLTPIVTGIVAIFAGAQVISAIATFASAISSIIGLLSGLGGLFAAGGLLGAGGLVSTTIGAFANLITVVVIPAITGFISAVGAMVAPFLPVIAVIAAVIAAVYLLCKHWDWVKEKAIQVRDKVVEVWNNIKDKVSDAVSRLGETVKGVWENIKNAFSGFVQNALNWGSDLISNFIQGIMNKFAALRDSVVNVANTVKSYLGFSEPEAGPLSDFHTYAPDMMELFAKGIRDNERVVRAQLENSFDVHDSVVGSTKGINNQSDVLSRVAEQEAPKRDLTVILELDKMQFAKAVYSMNNEETQRVGVSLARGY